MAKRRPPRSAALRQGEGGSSGQALRQGEGGSSGQALRQGEGGSSGQALRQGEGGSSGQTLRQGEGGRSGLAVLAASSMLVAAGELALSAFISDTSLRNGQLPFGARITLAVYDLGVLVAGVCAVGG